MKNVISTFVLLIFHYFFLHPVSAQPNIEWQKSLGGTKYEEAQAICQTSDGGYIVAGFTLSNNGDVSGNHGGYDLWVVKLSETKIRSLVCWHSRQEYLARS